MGVKKFGVKKFGDTSVLKFCFYLFSKPRYSRLKVPTVLLCFLLCSLVLLGLQGKQGRRHLE